MAVVLPKVDVLTLLDSGVKAAISLTAADLWCWLVDHGVPRSEIDRKPTKFVLNNLYKQKSSRPSKQKVYPES